MLSSKLSLDWPFVILEKSLIWPFVGPESYKYHILAEIELLVGNEVVEEMARIEILFLILKHLKY